MVFKEQRSFVEMSGNTRRKTFSRLVKERIAKYGVGTILDEEILAVLTDIPLEKISSWISEYAEVGELYKNIDLLHVTDTQRKKLHMLFEFSKRAKYVGKEKVVLDSSIKTGSYFQDILSHSLVEEFVMVALNAQNQVMKTVTISKGTVNETAVYAREVARRALLCNAVAVIVGHPHPGGSLRPSQSDITATKSLADALKSLSIKLLDHIIVTDTGYMSFAEQGLL
jgi:DNA repair protein RadC